MRTAVLSIAALAALAVGAGSADAQYIVRRGVVYGSPYPGYYGAPIVPAAPYVVPAAPSYVVPAAPGFVTPSAPTYVSPYVTPVVGYSYYQPYRFGYRYYR